MNYRIAQICIILSALSTFMIAGIYAYKTFYYDPKNEWKLINEENHKKDERHKYSFTYKTYLKIK